MCVRDQVIPQENTPSLSLSLPLSLSPSFLVRVPLTLAFSPTLPLSLGSETHTLSGI